MRQRATSGAAAMRGMVFNGDKVSWLEHTANGPFVGRRHARPCLLRKLLTCLVAQAFPPAIFYFPALALGLAAGRLPLSTKTSLARSFGGSRKGACPGACPLARGAAVFCGVGGTRPPRLSPEGKRERALKIPSLLPQAMNSFYSRFITSLHHRRFALLPFALFSGAACSGASWGPQYFCSGAAI